MEYDEDSPEYVGSKDKCVFCNRAFEVGEIIVVDQRMDWTFCPAEGDSPVLVCVLRWVMKVGRPVNANSMIFTGRAIPEYGGERTQCDHCGRNFDFGDLVIVDRETKNIFCYSDSGECAVKWMGGGDRIVRPEKMRFHGNT